MKQPLGVILAGGQALRMGGVDKAMLPLGGKTLLDHVIARLDPQVGSLALNANGDASRFRRYPMPVIGDSVDGFVGPLAGVLAGLDWAAAQGAETIVTVAADTPFFPFDLVPRLLLAAEGRPHIVHWETLPSRDCGLICGSVYCPPAITSGPDHVEAQRPADIPTQEAPYVCYGVSSC